MKAHRADWLLHASWALALLMYAHTLLAFYRPLTWQRPSIDILSCIVPRYPHQLAMASMLFCNMSLMSAVILTTRHQWATTSDASDAVRPRYSFPFIPS